MAISTKGAETRISTEKKANFDPHLIPYTKTNLKWIIELNVKLLGKKPTTCRIFITFN